MSTDITTSIISFCHYVRNNGYNAGIEETIDTLRAIDLIDLSDEVIFRNTLRAILSTTKEEFQQFNQLFNSYWKQRKLQERTVNPLGSVSYSGNKKSSQIDISYLSKTEVNEEDENKLIGSSTLERIRIVDFNIVHGKDLDELDELAGKLWKRMSVRLSRRYKRVYRKDKLNLRNTIRNSLSYGGEPFDLSYRGRKKIKSKILVILDISGSMEKYSIFYLKFLYVLHMHFKRIEAFTFSTRLSHITPMLRKGDLQGMLNKLTNATYAWYSGTKMADCLLEFETSYAGNMISKNTTVLIFSDGLDTGDSEQLVNAIKLMKARSKKIIWLNPLKGMEGYEPLTKGMSEVLPYLDIFISAHNLDSILQLEEHLNNEL